MAALSRGKEGRDSRVTIPEEKAFWERALTTINTAELVLDSDPDTSASCSYYAAFYAVSALFAGRKILFKSHDGVDIALNRDYIKTGILSKEIATMYRTLRKERQTGDYGLMDKIPRDSARADLGHAKKIIEAVYNLHPDEFARPGWMVSK
jgi:uncharacterized protein (UPF0332 family)